jgi:plasmid stabilization system protein ParE
MNVIVWTTGAYKDLAEIEEYISKDSPKYAQLMVDKIIDKVDILINNSHAGRSVPEKNDKISVN